MAEEFLIDLNDSKPKPERRQRPTPSRGAPQRSKSASLATMRPNVNIAPPAAGSGRPGMPSRQRSIRASNSGGLKSGNTLNPTSDHGGALMDSTDAWFDFGGGGGGSSSSGVRGQHLNGSNNHSIDDFGGDSGPGTPDAADALRKRPLRRGGGLTRGISERRMDFKAAQQQNTNTGGSGDDGPQRGVSRIKSGDLPRSSRGPPPTRAAPPRSRSDALMSARRESMKALYRANPTSSDVGGGGLQRRNSVDRGLGLGLDNSASDLEGSGSGMNLNSASDGTRHRPPARPRPTRTKSGLEGAGLTAVMERHRRPPPNRSKSTDSAKLFSGDGMEPTDEDHITSTEHDEKWLERRKNKMDEIMTLAQDVKERFVEERERQEEHDYHVAQQGDGHGVDLGDDDDQPMAMRTKKTLLEQVKKVATKTGGGMRSLGKGTVNAIHDPKLAAKRFGHLSKDVGKATVKTALDPKKMAKGATKLTMASAKMGAGLTTGVAQTTFGASKAVVKGSMKATTKSAKLTMKGTKKVVKGTVRAVTGKEKSKHSEEAEYNPQQLTDRHQSNFYDRIASMVETNAAADEADDHALEDAILAGIAAEENHGDAAATKKATKKAHKGGNSVLMPTNLVGGSGQGNWDV